MTERCLKHKIFIGVAGCPICKEIAEIKTDYENRIIDKNLEIISLKKQLDNEIENGIRRRADCRNYESKQEGQLACVVLHGGVYFIQHHPKNLHEPEKARIKPVKKAV